MKKEMKPDGRGTQGIRIKGNFVEEEKQAVYKKNIYKKLLKIKPCGFHRVVIDKLRVKAGTTTILENVSLSIACGALTVIIGKNGAGKSTLIKSILKEVSYEGLIEFRDLKDNTIGNLRVGYVPQHLNIEKNAPVSVYDLVAAYTTNVPVFLRKSRKLYEEIRERLSLFDGETLIDKQVGDLSGGELQRVLLTIACTPVPNLLILDEPVSGIDRNGRKLFYKILNELKQQYDMSIILVSHDLELTAEYADSVVLLDRTVLKEGKAKEVMASEEFREVFGYLGTLPEHKGGGE